jgi:hypothetical protein
MGKKNWDIKHRLFEVQFFTCSQGMLHEVTWKCVTLKLAIMRRMCTHMGRLCLLLQEVYQMFPWPAHDKAILPVPVVGMELGSQAPPLRYLLLEWNSVSIASLMIVFLGPSQSIWLARYLQQMLTWSKLSPPGYKYLILISLCWDTC